MSVAAGSVATTLVREWNAGRTRTVQDDLAGEEPLEIRVGDTAVSVTMRTPGHDLELAAGFLFTEGVLASADQLDRIDHRVDATGRRTRNVVEATLGGGVDADLGRLQRHFYTSSSCGICGKTSVDAIRARGLARLNGTLRVAPEMLCGLPRTLHGAQAVFDRTGGLHAAALFDATGRLLLAREDVGRHNAVDKLVGRAFLDRALPLAGQVLLVSGRGSFEIVQKAIVAGVSIVACVSAPSSLAVQLARELGLTLVGFLRDCRFVVYAGAERIASDPFAEGPG